MEDLRTKPRYGRWWNITKAQNRFIGTLKIGDNDLGKLVVRGKERALSLFGLTAELSTIWGQFTSEPAKKVSIFRVRSTRGPTTTSPPKRWRETEIDFSSNYTLIGGHIKSTEHPFIDRLRFGLTSLEEWCNSTGFSGKFERPKLNAKAPEDNRAKLSVEISFDNSSTEFFDVGGGRRLRFLSRYNGPEYFDHEKHLELKERNKIEIVFPRPASILEALDEIRIWQTFITFGLRKPVFLDDIVVAKASRNAMQVMQLFVAERKWSVSKRRPYHREVLFDQVKLGSNIGKRLKEWREKQAAIHMAVLLFRGAGYLTDAYIHTNTLTYLQALEVFHRQLYGGDKFPNADARKYALKMLRKAIPTDRAGPGNLHRTISGVSA